MLIASMVSCIALNVYHEARGEPLEGQHAVALVTRNRMLATNTDACTVVHSPYQFSWTIYKPKATDPRAYKIAEQVAINVLMGKIPDFTGGATFYHHKGIKPYWATKFTYTKTIGNHKFYFTLEKPQ